MRALSYANGGATRVRPIGAALALLFVAACSRTPEPSRSQRSLAPVRTSEPTKPKPPAEIVWTAPARWRSEKPGAMRVATYRIPKAAGDPVDGDLSVSRAGGTVAMNIKRWSEQFERRATTSRRQEEIAGLAVHIVEIQGDYRQGVPGVSGPQAGAKKGWGMLAAIVETADSPTFFKLTGPAKTVTEAKPEFEAMIAGLHAK